MTLKNPIHESIKVKPEAVRLVKEMVKAGFYRKSEAEKFDALKKLGEDICGVYRVDKVNVKTGGVVLGAFAMYQPASKTINLNNTSIVSFLHELRHHLQHVGRLQASTFSIS